MSELTSLQVFFTQRLTAAAVEIFGVVEKTVVEYQNEIRRSKEENERLQRTLDLVFKPDVKLHKGDLQHFSLPVSEEEDLPEQQQHHEQEWNSSLGQENPETPQIKEEEQGSMTSEEEEQLQALQFDIKEFIFTPPSVNIERDQEDSLQLSHLYQTGESRERDSLPTNTTQQFKTEPDGEDYRVSEPTRDSWTLFEVIPDSSAEQSDNIESDEGVESGGLQSGIKPLELKRTCSNKEQISSINTEGRKTSEGKVPMKSHLSHSGALTQDRSTEEKPYSCLTCNKCFQRRCLLKVHERTHTGKKPHQCKQCGKRFLRKTNLSVHMRTHTGERPFKCYTCGKCFRTGGNRNAHQKIHTGEKPHQCKECGRCFLRPSHLSAHMRTHRERPLECN